ncbi:MAG: histidine phosphatase family protein [Candidatus Merdivicinus sp.]|jgi:alpha-ribazole phosphatase
MANKVVWIRHGKTAGNLRGAYIGRTDEPLCAEGIEQLKQNFAKKMYPPCDGKLLVSPLKRCVETAKILFGGVEAETVPDFQETDFGDFEGKSYAELNGNPAYQRWIDSGGTIPFPGGEAPEDFRNRCVRAFAEQMKKIPDGQTVVIVCHGGTIMAILDAFSFPHRGFYEWQVRNGEGFCGRYEPETGQLVEITPLMGQEE